MSKFGKTATFALAAALMTGSLIAASAATAADTKSSRYAYESCKGDLYISRGFETYEDCFEWHKEQFQKTCPGFNDGGEKYCY